MNQSAFIKIETFSRMVFCGVVFFAMCAHGADFAIDAAYRRAFVRGERDAEYRLSVRNAGNAALAGVVVNVIQFDESGRKIADAGRNLGCLGTNAVAELSVPIETRLRPGWRKLSVFVSAKDGDGSVRNEKAVLDYGIGPAHGDRMPVQMWHYTESNEENSESKVADFGFTHAYNNFESKIGTKLSPKWKDWQIAKLDRAVMCGLMLTGGVVVEYPPSKDKNHAEFMRKKRDGKPGIQRIGKWDRMQPEVGDPRMLSHIRKFTEGEAEFLCPHAGFAGALLITENRDHVFPSFGGEADRYYTETGRRIPDTVTNKVYDLELAQRRFPDGVVPDDDEILSYYTWFWRGGDGWPAYYTAAGEAFHRRIREDDPDRFTFFDPAVRCPPIWGSGGSARVLNQWCYANEPMNVAGPAEEMLAMTSGRPGQRTSIMTQLICYRRVLAPKGVKPIAAPEWLERRPDADFITIAPDVLDEATWCMLAKPVDMVMYHGWGTVYETGSATFYVFTNGETPERLRHLLKNVVAPLGPTLKRLGRAQPQVAVLESFTTVALGGSGSWGWSAPSITYLQRARLDPCVVYEDMIRNGALDGVKVLYAPQCRFLPKSVIERIRAFQQRGGILLGDEQLTTALKPDIVVPVVSFAPPPKSDLVEGITEQENAKDRRESDHQRGTRLAKEKMVAQAESLRKALKGRYTARSDSSSPDLVVFNRRWGETDYLFTINDRRTFGDYVGGWGRQMEKGLPLSGSVTLRGAASRTEAVYELSRNERVDFQRNGEDVTIDLEYETTDGRLFVFLPRPIAAVRAEASDSVSRGGAIDVTFKVLDGDGNPIPALLPVEVRVFDAAGRELDGAGYACAQGGEAKVRVQTNLDDAPGGYKVICRDRASGLMSTVIVGDAASRPWWKRIFK